MSPDTLDPGPFKPSSRVVHALYNDCSVDTDALVRSLIVNNVFSDRDDLGHIDVDVRSYISSSVFGNPTRTCRLCPGRHPRT
jgi:hypothetical protein